MCRSSPNGSPHVATDPADPRLAESLFYELEANPTRGGVFADDEGAAVLYSLLHSVHDLDHPAMSDAKWDAAEDMLARLSEEFAAHLPHMSTSGRFHPGTTNCGGRYASTGCNCASASGGVRSESTRGLPLGCTDEFIPDVSAALDAYGNVMYPDSLPDGVCLASAATVTPGSRIIVAGGSALATVTEVERGHRYVIVRIRHDDGSEDSSPAVYQRAPMLVLGDAPQIAEEKVTDLASSLHDEWRSERFRPETGGYEPRMKDDGKGGEVDIANTDYADLPEKWQAENKAAALGALRIVTRSHARPDGSIEQMSALVHEDWLSRNGDWASAEQKLPYAELSEDEKEKDRVLVRSAIRVLDIGSIPEESPGFENS